MKNEENENTSDRVENSAHSFTEGSEGPSSKLCTHRGVLCYNINCLLSTKCIDHVTRDAYWKSKIADSKPTAVAEPVKDESAVEVYFGTIEEKHKESELRQKIIDAQRITLSEHWAKIQELESEVKRLEEEIKEAKKASSDTFDLYVSVKTDLEKYREVRNAVLRMNL